MIVLSQKNMLKSEKFLNLCKRVLTDTVYNEQMREKFFVNPKNISEKEVDLVIKKNIENSSLNGEIWPERAHTMIGIKRLDNLHFCIKEVIKNKISGDFIETGVWRGGASIFMKLVLNEYDVKDKNVYVADSFRGLPPPNPKIYPKDQDDEMFKEDFLRVSKKEVQNNFRKYRVLDEHVKFMEGWFEETTKNPPFEKLSILRLDGDMYGSTWSVLMNLYAKLSVGGFVIIDDFGLPNCKAAVDDFREKFHISEPMIKIDWAGSFWKKEVDLVIN